MISYSNSPLNINVFQKKDKECPWSKIPSLDTRKGVAAKRDSIKSTQHTIAPAYNKGAYQVISKQNIKDIGR